MEREEVGFICTPDLLTQKQGDIEYQGKGGKIEPKEEKTFFIPLFQIHLGKSLSWYVVELPIWIQFDKHFCEQKSQSLVSYRA